MSTIRSLLLAVLLIGVPIGALVAMRAFSSDGLDAVSLGAEPLVSTPTSREVRDLQRVNVVLEWEEGAVVRAPGWSGTVTAVPRSGGWRWTRGTQ